MDPKDALAISRDAPSEEFRNVFMMAAEKVAKSESEVFVMMEDKKQNKVKKNK